MIVRAGTPHHTPDPIDITAADGTTWAIVDIARLKKNPHQLIVFPGTRPSKSASQATNPTPKPGENSPVAISSGSTIHWCPVFQGIGLRAAICVPTPR